MKIDDSVAEFLPNFESRVREALVTLLGEDTAGRIKLGLAKDGSGVGGGSVLNRANDSCIDCSSGKESFGYGGRIGRCASQAGVDIYSCTLCFVVMRYG